jgi:hypothetical protein
MAPFQIRFLPYLVIVLCFVGEFPMTEPDSTLPPPTYTHAHTHNTLTPCGRENSRFLVCFQTALAGVVHTPCCYFCPVSRGSVSLILPPSFGAVQLAAVLKRRTASHLSLEEMACRSHQNRTRLSLFSFSHRGFAFFVPLACKMTTGFEQYVPRPFRSRLGLPCCVAVHWKAEAAQ